MLPKSRKDRIVVQEVNKEVLLYDLDNDRVHCLNPMTSVIWRHADGNATVQTLLELARKEVDGDADEAGVQDALERLSDAGLLVEPVKPAAGDHQSRRDVIRRAAVAGGALAASVAITSIMAPTPAQAQSLPPDPGPD